MDDEFDTSESEIDRMLAEGEPVLIIGPASAGEFRFYVNGLPAVWSDERQAWVAGGGVSWHRNTGTCAA